MKSFFVGIMVVVAFNGCTASKAEVLRDRYRTANQTAKNACVAEASKCGGYGATHWRMSVAQVTASTGCVTVGSECVLTTTQGGLPVDERYLFRDERLAGVLVDFGKGEHVSYDSAVASLSADLGAPTWQQDTAQELDRRVAEARWREVALVVTGFAPVALFGGGLDDARNARFEKELGGRQRCSNWTSDLTTVVLCQRSEARLQTQTTTALFSSRFESAPERQQQELGSWRAVK